MASTGRVKTKEEQQIEIEVAAEVTAEFLARCAKDLAAEKKKELRDADKIAALEEQLETLNREKLAVLKGDAGVIRKAFYIYAGLLRQKKA